MAVKRVCPGNLRAKKNTHNTHTHMDMRAQVKPHTNHYNHHIKCILCQLHTNIFIFLICHTDIHTHTHIVHTHTHSERDHTIYQKMMFNLTIYKVRTLTTKFKSISCGNNGFASKYIFKEHVRSCMFNSDHSNLLQRS